MPKRIAVYHPLFDSLPQDPREVPNPALWVMEHLDKTHPLVREAVKQAERHGWGPQETIAFLLMVVDGSAAQLTVESLQELHEARESESSAGITVRTPGQEQDRCFFHKDVRLAEGEPCPECITEMLAKRPDWMSEEEARRMLDELVRDILLAESAESAPAKQNAPTATTIQ